MPDHFQPALQHCPSPIPDPDRLHVTHTNSCSLGIVPSEVHVLQCFRTVTCFMSSTMYSHVIADMCADRIIFDINSTEVNLQVYNDLSHTTANLFFERVFPGFYSWTWDIVSESHFQSYLNSVYMLPWKPSSKPCTLSYTEKSLYNHIIAFPTVSGMFQSFIPVRTEEAKKIVSFARNKVAVLFWVLCFVIHQILYSLGSY